MRGILFTVGNRKNHILFSFCFFLIFDYIFFMHNTFLEHGFELAPAELEQFQKFLTLFIEYNSHTNLSAIRDEEGIIEKHFVDSLYGAQVIGESDKEEIRLLDI